MAVVQKPMVPFWGRCTTHCRTYFSGDWDVHWGYDLDFDPWPICETGKVRANHTSNGAVSLASTKPTQEGKHGPDGAMRCSMEQVQGMNQSQNMYDLAGWDEKKKQKHKETNQLGVDNLRNSLLRITRRVNTVLKACDSSICMPSSPARGRNFK